MTQYSHVNARIEGADNIHNALTLNTVTISNAWQDLCTATSVGGFNLGALWISITSVTGTCDTIQIRALAGYQESVTSYNFPILTMNTNKVSVDNHVWQLANNTIQSLVIGINNLNTVKYVKFQIKATSLAAVTTRASGFFNKGWG